jgi:glycine cleavage system protein P-like pyridoxal-binding family
MRYFMTRKIISNIVVILFSLTLLSWTTFSIFNHSHSYIDTYGNEIIIENTQQFQATLDTNFIINNLTSKQFDSTLSKADKPMCSFVVSDIKRVKHKRNFCVYDLRVRTIPHSKDISFSLRLIGYIHYYMSVLKVNGQNKITNVTYLYAEI